MLWTSGKGHPFSLPFNGMPKSAAVVHYPVESQCKEGR